MNLFDGISNAPSSVILVIGGLVFLFFSLFYIEDSRVIPQLKVNKRGLFISFVFLLNALILQLFKWSDISITIFVFPPNIANVLTFVGYVLIFVSTFNIYKIGNVEFSFTINHSLRVILGFTFILGGIVLRLFGGLKESDANSMLFLAILLLGGIIFIFFSFFNVKNTGISPRRPNYSYGSVSGLVILISGGILGLVKWPVTSTVNIIYSPIPTILVVSGFIFTYYSIFEKNTGSFIKKKVNWQAAIAGLLMLSGGIFLLLRVKQPSSSVDVLFSPTFTTILTLIGLIFIFFSFFSIQKNEIRSLQSVYLRAIITGLLILSGGIIWWLQKLPDNLTSYIITPTTSPVPTLTPKPTITLTQLPVLSLTPTNLTSYIITPATSPVPILTPKPTITLTQLPVLSLTPTTLVPVLTPTPNWLYKAYEEKRGDTLFWILTSIFSALLVYLVGMGALLINANRFGSNIFSRSLLTTIASKPLFIAPGLGKWVLFLGYKQRLLTQADITRAARDYFGLPAIGPDQKYIFSASGGENLHEIIANSLDFQKPVVIIAKGGGGKTTLLARWSYLALSNNLPTSLNGFMPIFITPAYYGGNLLESITSVLHERDGVAVEKNIVQAQLESSRFLILFDGVSEIEGDQNKGLQEILRTARNADYQHCRFLITTRAGLNIPPETTVFQLQPLTSDVAIHLLERFRNKELGYYVRRQLESFGEKPIEPLLFSMILLQGEESIISSTRSQLYEKYFKRLLHVNEQKVWTGWSVILEEFAKWFSLDTGLRGVGLMHDTLIDSISGKMTMANKGNLIEYVNRYHRLTLKDEFALLEKLETSGILQQNRRWRFAHDTFEEYFAACYIVSHLTRYEKMPSLGRWMINDAHIQSFVGVIEFIKEMADDEILKMLIASNLPKLWIKALQPDTKENH